MHPHTEEGSNPREGAGGAAAADGALNTARIRFLGQQCLLAELQGMLQEARGADIDQGGHEGGLHGTQAGRQPPALPADAAASLATHMQAASLAQRLRLPAGDPSPGAAAAMFMLAPGAGSSSDDAADAAASDQLGSRQHLLGVTPQHLRQQFLPSRKAAQKAHAPLLPFLERRLRQQAHGAVAAVAGAAAAEQGPAQARHQALAAVAAKRAALAQLRGAAGAGLRQLAGEVAGYLGELDGVHAALQQLLGGCVLGEQPRLSQVDRTHQEANMQQLISKLQVMQLSIRTDTYGPENLAALTAIRQELLQAEQEMHSSIAQVESDLAAYTQLGDDFHTVVEEFGDVLAKTQELDRVFEKFACIEDEAAALYS